MTTVPLTIQVPPQMAEAFHAASAEDRLKMEWLLGLQLERLLSPPKESLREIMDEMSRQAQANGLTPEVLQSILDDE